MTQRYGGEEAWCPGVIWCGEILCCIENEAEKKEIRIKGRVEIRY